MLGTQHSKLIQMEKKSSSTTQINRLQNIRSEICKYKIKPDKISTCNICFYLFVLS